jgi:hypothetical protein
VIEDEGHLLGDRVLIDRDRHPPSACVAAIAQ